MDFIPLSSSEGDWLDAIRWTGSCYFAMRISRKVPYNVVNHWWKWNFYWNSIRLVLCRQSNTWSSYKHHNTGKFLFGCTPNGAISYVSQLYVGSVSDVELTRISGYLQTLDGKSGVSVMADRGFTVRDMLAGKGVELNIPPFMEGRCRWSQTWT